MHLKQAKIYLFVAYLGLLINLGPSLHHADFLGFHNHSGNDSTCCHSHHADSHRADSNSAHSHCNHSHAQTETSDDVKVLLTADDHHCPFCEFFDQFHVIAGANQTLEFSGFASILAIERPSNGSSIIFNPVARGPPAAV
ncbi:MAG: hypothetical protein AB8B55_02815 [Mariniblastus sp.]